MRGFIHIVEIIIVGLVLLTLFANFATIPSIREEWRESELRQLGFDALNVLDKAEISWLNSTELKKGLSRVFGYTPSLVYSLKIKNAIKPNISVGCVCNQKEFDWLKSVLKNFTLNDERINFLVFKIDPTKPEFPIYADVIYLGNYFLDSYANFYIPSMSGYVYAGGSLFEIRDLDNETKIDNVQKKIFGLKWNDSLTLDSSNITFAITPVSEFYNIYKYFRHIPSSIDFTSWKEFENFLDRERVFPDDGTERIILIQKNTGTPALIVKKNQGRTAWLSAGNESKEERRVLIKALVCWLAGEEYDAIPKKIANAVKVLYLTAIPEGRFTPGMFQPIEIEMRLGYIY